MYFKIPKNKFLHDRWIFFLKNSMIHNSMIKRTFSGKKRVVLKKSERGIFASSPSSGYMIISLFELFWCVQNMKFMWKKQSDLLYSISILFSSSHSLIIFTHSEMNSESKIFTLLYSFESKMNSSQFFFLAPHKRNFSLLWDFISYSSQEFFLLRTPLLLAESSTRDVDQIFFALI